MIMIRRKVEFQCDACESDNHISQNVFLVLDIITKYQRTGDIHVVRSGSCNLL